MPHRGTFKFLYWPKQEDSARKGYLFQVSGQYERKGISPVEVYERVAAHLGFSFGQERITRTEQLP